MASVADWTCKSPSRFTTLYFVLCPSSRSRSCFRHSLCSDAGISRYKSWINSHVSSSPAHSRPLEEYQLLAMPSEDNVVLSSSKAPVTTHPPLSYASPWAFVESISARFLNMWTRSFTLSLIGGQLLSLCVTSSSVMTTELVDRKWVLPSTQTFFT
jgi:hypothetical protein